MITFIVSICLLIAGYAVYGKIVERAFGADPQRPTPVETLADGVDYVKLPAWKIFLIQFLNIAGTGPIFGAIMGVMFGPPAFLWIVFGTIFAGGVHDYLSGMMSVRASGASLPEIVGGELGGGMQRLMRVFALLLMILVGTVFVYNPADLLAMLTPESLDRTFWVIAIFLYYMAATLVPIDKLIGRLYPLFGFALLFMAVGIAAMLFVHHDAMPEVWQEFHNHKASPEATPVFPMMFVSIACGAISGFHATQSPMMARCIANERWGRPVFYGAMVTEGVVALIWAAAAVTFTGSYSSLQATLADSTPATLVNEVSIGWLGTFGGILAVLGVVAAPITSGDTALRSARLIAADFTGLKQRRIVTRLLVSIPVFALCFVLMLLPYEALWRYFAWCNQTMATFTLWAITVYLARRRRLYQISLLPALFMTCVSVTYILFAPEGIGKITHTLFGFAPSYALSVTAGIAVSLLLLLIFARRRQHLAPRN